MGGLLNDRLIQYKEVTLAAGQELTVTSVSGFILLGTRGSSNFASIWFSNAVIHVQGTVTNWASTSESATTFKIGSGNNSLKIKNMTSGELKAQIKWIVMYKNV